MGHDTTSGDSGDSPDCPDWAGRVPKGLFWSNRPSSEPVGAERPFNWGCGGAAVQDAGGGRSPPPDILPLGLRRIHGIVSDAHIFSNTCSKEWFASEKALQVQALTAVGARSGFTR